jgi:hypothetical protein
MVFIPPTNIISEIDITLFLHSRLCLHVTTIMFYPRHFSKQIFYHHQRIKQFFALVRCRLYAIVMEKWSFLLLSSVSGIETAV